MDDLCCLRAAFTRQFNLFCQDRDGIRRNPNASRRNSAVVYNKRSAEGMATCRLIMKPLSLIEQLGLGLLSTTREETKFSLVHIVAIIPPSVINDALRNVIESPSPSPRHLPNELFFLSFSTCQIATTMFSKSFFLLFFLNYISRYWLRLSGMQQQLLALFWREEGRALRTTAMVISSFTCCWLPFFVWLLPFQIHPSLTAGRREISPSAGVFIARLAAFSNVNNNAPTFQ